MATAFGQTLPTDGGDEDTWGALLLSVLNAADDFVTEQQACFTLPLYKGNGTYRLVTKNRIPCTITGLTYATDTGTLTISSVSISATPITGLSSLSATTTAQDATATAANTLGTTGNTTLDITVASITTATELYLNFIVNQTGDRV